MKKTFILAIIILITNVFSAEAQSSSNIDFLGIFEDLKTYEEEYYDLNTGEYVPFMITGNMPNVSIDISTDKSKRRLEVSFWHNRTIQRLNSITKIRTFKYTFNTIFFVCSLDDNTELSIQCQLNEGIAFIYYQNLAVVSLDYECKWSTLKKLCNQWY